MTTNTLTAPPPARDPARATLSAQVADLVVRHRAGEAGALTQLVRTVSPHLYGIARACRLPGHLADDIVQDTLLSTIEHLDGLRDPTCTLAWLSVIARRHAVRASIVERQRARSERVDAAEQLPDPLDCEEIVLGRLSRDVLMRALAALPDRHRDLLRLLFLDDPVDYATMAAQLGMPVGSIGPTQQRGLRKVRDALLADRAWGVEPPLRCA